MREIKCIKSDSYKEAVRRVIGKLDRQGQNFIVDLSESPIDDETAFLKLAKLFDDPKIGRFLIVKNGELRLMKK